MDLRKMIHDQEMLTFQTNEVVLHQIQRRKRHVKYEYIMNSDLSIVVFKIEFLESNEMIISMEGLQFVMSGWYLIDKVIEDQFKRYKELETLYEIFMKMIKEFKNKEENRFLFSSRNYLEIENENVRFVKRFLKEKKGL